MNNLFLEGPIQTGKSTLIREVLGEHLKDCGGFASQRLVDENGQTRGFRIGPAALTPLTAPDAGTYQGVFRYIDRMGNVHTDQEVFDTLGTFYLASSGSCPLVLLDEIGGAELLREPFRLALHDLLASDVPCLGVVKQVESARRMQRSYGFSDQQDGGAPYPSIAERNLQLRKKIEEEFGGEILYYERAADGMEADGSRVRSALEDFVRRIW